MNIYKFGVFALGLFAFLIGLGFVGAARASGDKGFLIVTAVFLCLVGIAAYMLWTWPE